MAAWVENVSPRALYLSVLVLGEIRQGIERLRERDPIRARALEAWLARLRGDFADRVLPITAPIAEAWGRLNAVTPLPPIDGLLAATALVHGFTLVTRDVAPHERVGIPVVDPWG